MDLLEICCPPLLTEALSADDAEQVASLFKVLGDPVRLRLLSLIAAQDGAECCACDLVEPLGRSQPTVSHHLKALREAGLLTRHRVGAEIHYRVAVERLNQLRDALKTAGTPAARAKSACC
ncbi:MAG: ArsR/SmtB family transcription factor [Mycobacteriales bacterium]|nr:metalloregulator ArsR/SmtB family transcription factor [Frankia sp.]